MLSEAEQIATMLEQIGQRVLTYCEEFSEEVLLWSPPLPHTPSLFALASLIIEEIDTWVLIPVGGKIATDNQEVQRPSSGTYAELATQYKHWIENVQKILSILPNSFMDLYVEDTNLQSAIASTSDARLTIRACLLTALERCSVLLGRIQGLRELFCDGERILQEVEDTRQSFS